MNTLARAILIFLGSFLAYLSWPLWLRDWWDSLIPDFTDAHDIWADPFEVEK